MTCLLTIILFPIVFPFTVLNELMKPQKGSHRRKRNSGVMCGPGGPKRRK